MKQQVDKDNESGFPLLYFFILLLIALVLYLIWDKLNERITPHKKGGIHHTAAAMTAEPSSMGNDGLNIGGTHKRHSY